MDYYVLDTPKIQKNCNTLPVNPSPVFLIFEKREVPSNAGVADVLELIPYKNYAFRSIIETCTSWPKIERYSSGIQHQNLNNKVEELSFGDADCQR